MNKMYKKGKVSVPLGFLSSPHVLYQGPKNPVDLYLQSTSQAAKPWNLYNAVRLPLLFNAVNFLSIKTGHIGCTFSDI